MSKPKMSMKLLIDKSKRKVLFAEAGKECVDFLFHILSLPLGSVVGFLTKESMAGSIGTLYGSLEGLNNDFMQEGFSKECLLRPTSAVGSASDVPLLTTKPADATKQFYFCAGCYGYVSDVPEAKCPGCWSKMNREVKYQTPTAMRAAKNIGESSGGGGYVKGVVTYMIMDDLSVQPIVSAISIITMLNKFNIQDVDLLEEKTVTLDVNLGLQLLKASLTSKTVLTDTFVSKIVITDTFVSRRSASVS